MNLRKFALKIARYYFDGIIKIEHFDFGKFYWMKNLTKIF